MNDQTEPREPQTLVELGWRPFFSSQLTDEEQNTAVPARVIAVHRDALVVHDGETERRVHLGRHWTKSTSQDRPTTGDWLLLDPAREWISRLLDRETVIKRLSAGVRRMRIGKTNRRIPSGVKYSQRRAENVIGTH